MSVAKKSLQFVIKIVIVLLVPYYAVNSSTRTTSISIIAGTWGQWPQQIFGLPVADPFWQSYQLLIALFVIAPLVIFAFVYHQKQVDRKYIVSALGAVSISCIVTFLFTPQYYSFLIGGSVFNVVPNVVSLSIFVFIFWPLLQKTWPSSYAMRYDREKKEGVTTRLRNSLVRVIPFNAATAVWFALVIIPAIITISNLTITESQVSYMFTLGGGLYSIQHDYRFLIGGGYYPSINSRLYLLTAGYITIGELLVWTLNLLTGITALRFIQGNATKKRVYILMTLSFLVYAIPSAITIGFAFVRVPLPIFQIFIILVMKYVRVPVPVSDDMIRVSFRTRISSMLRGKRPSRESREVQENVEEQD